MSERWLPIPGWEGWYEVSDTGRVRSVDRVITERPTGIEHLWRGRVLKPRERTSGHLTVNLSRDATDTFESVHRLVLIAFVGPAPDDMEACHRNGMPADNRPENLYWGTRSDNIRDQIRHGVHNQISKTHCVNGHEFSPENTYRKQTATGIERVCKTCQQAAAKRYRQRKNAQGVVA